MEQRRRRIMIGKPRPGTGADCKITLPVPWVREMGISKEDRDVIILFDGKRIVIEKEKGELE